MKAPAGNWFNTYKLHLLIWSLFIMYETVVIGLVFGEFGHPLTYLAHYSVAISLFYIHADLVLPWSLKGKMNAIWKLPLVVGAELWSYILLCFLSDSLLIHAGIIKHEGHFTLDVNFHLKSLYRGLLFAGFSTGYYYLKKFNKERERSNNLEKQHLTEIISRQKYEQQLAKAENDFLKAQINPHFLFNTLDFIYHNILAVSPAAANTIIALSEMMRFAIDADQTGGFIQLGDEIEQVNHLIYLTQVRKTEPLNLFFEADVQVFSLTLIPLVLLTLAENMIKHGILNDALNPATFRINLIHNHLVITTSNLISPRYEAHGKDSNGLSNIDQRLKYAYGDKALFSYQALDNGFFETGITIDADILGQPALSETFPGIDIKSLRGSADAYQTRG